jgi:choline dehydrogenase-like flavoprotein
MDQRAASLWPHALCIVRAVQDDRRIVVVGSGPAGATAAKFLCDAGLEVTLLEAGAQHGALGLTARLGGFTLARLKQSPLVARDGITATGDPSAELFEELAPGGLSNHWSCAVPRFSREDFADAERAGEMYAWPLGYDDLAPFYDRVEPLLHISGTRADARQLPAGKVRHAWELSDVWNVVAREAARRGRSVLSLPYAYGSDTTVTLSNNVWNSFVRVVKPTLRTGRLAVRFDAHVHRLEWSARTGRVEAVVFRNKTTGKEESLGCKAIVLAAGAVNTAQVLLQSKNTEFPEGLGNRHGVLGAYLHDHPLGKLIIDLGCRVPVHPPAYVTRAPLDRSAPLYAAACVQWTGIVMLARSVLRGSVGRLPWVGFNVFGTMPPAKENHVALDPAHPRANGSAGLELDVRHPPESLRVLIEARDELVDFLARAGLAPRVRLWHVEPVGRSIHYAGTCRMHASPEYGMLDGWSRLHAVPNVVVADSAAFTTGPEKNPVLTAMALAARASDRLANDLRTGAL